MNNPLRTPKIYSISGNATQITKTRTETVLDGVDQTDLLPDEYKKALYLFTTQGLIVVPAVELPGQIKLNAIPRIWVCDLPGIKACVFHASFKPREAKHLFHEQSLPVMNQLIHKYLKKGRLQ